MKARCCDCREPFERAAGEDWKKRCLVCWLRTKGAKPPAADPLRDELRAHLRPLLQLAHPDKHDGSPVANRVTAWLLDVRDRLA